MNSDLGLLERSTSAAIAYVMKTTAYPFKWHELPLPGQFLLAGAIVMGLAMLAVGQWVTTRIEDAVVQNSATSAALFMESFISPLGQELADTDTLSPPARQALKEIFDGTTIGERIVSYKIWKPDGTAIHSSDPSIIGQKFEPSHELAAAASGKIASTFADLNDLENSAEAALGIPLLEVYVPIREAWTGEIIAVAEFYDRAEVLADELSDARRKSWLVVGTTFLSSGMLLLGIVQAGGRTIREQRQKLRLQLAETEKISKLNALLRRRSVAASSRAIAQTERAVRRIGFDLHDGPAQYLSLASLRMANAFDSSPTSSKDGAIVSDSLNKALEEIRIISRGLALPDLDQLGVLGLIERAVQDHEKQTGLHIHLSLPEGYEPKLDYTQKLCVFRFLQETLSNASRHADVDRALVKLGHENGELTVAVFDQGRGFDPSKSRSVRSDGGQGLFGLMDRAESIGGRIDIASVPEKGTRIILRLPEET